MLKQQTFVGERGYHNKEAAYLLPNDSTEHERLEIQAVGLRALAGDKVIHAPLSAPAIHKVLDIGCGTGVVTHELSSKYPDAQVYGVDLTPVPSLRTKLKNTEYIEGDVFKLADNKNPDPRFRAASFDYVFSRFLVMGMMEWKKYVELCASLTTPGGWVEMHDFEFSIRHLPENTPPADREAIFPTSLTLADMQNERPVEGAMWQTSMCRLLETKGLDMTIGLRLPQYFADVGLEDIRICRFPFTFGNHDDLTDVEKRYLPLSKVVLTRMFPDVVKKMQAERGPVSDAELKEASRLVQERLDNWEGNREFVWIYIVCGRKPL